MAVQPKGMPAHITLLRKALYFSPSDWSLVLEVRQVMGVGDSALTTCMADLGKCETPLYACVESQQP